MTRPSIEPESTGCQLEFLTTMPCLRYRSVGVEYIIISKADGGISFFAEVDYFKASWPRSIRDESKRAYNGERECF